MVITGRQLIAALKPQERGGDNVLTRNEVEHNSHNVYYRSPFGAAEAGSKVRLGLHIKSPQQINQVLLRLWQEKSGEKLLPLTSKDPIDSDNRYFSIELTMPEKGCLLWYYFIISCSDGTCYYGNNHEQWGGLGDVYDHVPPSYQITVYNKGAKTPDWFKHTVMYQIFPDRFYRKGDKLIAKEGAVYHASWQDDPFYYKDPDTKEIISYDFYGGNLAGIKEKLDYLKDMGISVIYLNPVFESESNHHYDTGDYHKIDPILGTNEEFRDLVATAKQKGISVIIDGVFSHTGSNSRYFNRKGKYDGLGAFQSQDSPYFEWYNFRNFPYEYDCWWNFDTLPNVTETTPSYMDFIFRKPDSVLHHWLNEGVAGWRLDVIDELPEPFSQGFYAELKKTNPDAVMIGEVWEDASHKIAYGQPREYLCGQEMDSAMNYPFRKILLDFFLGYIDARCAMRQLESLRENYPAENFYAMMNLIGSHDVQRAITLLGEAAYYEGMPAVEQSRSHLDKAQYALGAARLKMAALLQMTYPGVPCVYYGDEIGMEGFKDPYNRRPYKWDSGDADLRVWYKKIIKERNDSTVLQTGELLPLNAEGDILAYARVVRGGHDVFGADAKDAAYIVIFNRHRTESQTVTLDISDFADGQFVDVLAVDQENSKVMSSRGHLTVKVKALTGKLFKYEPLPRKYPRAAGILLHPTSLPSKYGIGDLGKEAYKFVDFLAAAGQKVWQILPLGPVGFGYSPYQSPSAFAGNPLLIDIDELIEHKWLTLAEARVPYVSKSSFIDFEWVIPFKHKCFKKAWALFQKDKDVELKGKYQAFCEQEAYWLDDYALFEAAKHEFKNKPWFEWAEPIRRRDKKALLKLAERVEDYMGFVRFVQFIFHSQWHRLHEYAKSKGVKIMGDMPIFISHDSADVWANQALFDLNEDGTAKTVAGVPPDYFSATGQLWGNPQYNWPAMEQENYAWWKQRFQKLYELVDIVRIDHFRGFESYWEVDGKAETAINGHWRKGPGKPFFDLIKKSLGNMEIVAEDLGVITDEVEALRDACDFPGMKVLHFTLHYNAQGRLGFVAPENSIVYTGTHDNNTTVGWYTQDIDEATRAAVARLLNVRMDRPRDIAKGLLNFAYASEARLAIAPMQDLLGLDERGRMNTPGTVGLNWKWCLKPDYQLEVDAAELKAKCEKYDR